MTEEIRYYRGKIKCQLILMAGKVKKALIKYLEFGIVGPKDLQKMVVPDMTDITLSRHCWRKKSIA